MFLISRYDAADDRIRWLCPRCHAFEWKETMTRQPMELSDNGNPSEDEAMAEDSSVHDNENDDDVNVEFNDLNEEEEQNPLMDSGIIVESKDDDNNLSCMDDQTADHESMDEETDHVSYKLEYQKDKIPFMTSRSAVSRIRANVDEVYGKLYRLCDILDEEPQSKKLFAESDADEQVRLMAIAPKEWGRQKNRKMFQSKPNQARRSLVLRKNKEMLAYPQCLRGNIPLSDVTIDSVVKFYYEDGISQSSSNSKDAIKINRQPVAVRLLEMTALDAYRIFNERFPGAVAKSTFTTLRPREVKIATPHDTCMCITHENMDLLLKSICLLRTKNTRQVHQEGLSTGKTINYFSDGASSHFKNNASILNLIPHKADFNLEASWIFTASGHGKGAGDGISAGMKTIARRVTLSKNILLSTAKDFHEFSKA
ncbi:unnamed protein product [Rotaria socialis]|uniref:Uncharacterized protein n=1 Tax=Rotaria socialis TaxID=392032 RepID=A0A820JCL6_9BILA|nr:unnamed protein product [Rotaria socialis]CAF4357991.1 unnamed protein product [Rotaria socialis]